MPGTCGFRNGAHTVVRKGKHMTKKSILLAVLIVMTAAAFGFAATKEPAAGKQPPAAAQESQKAAAEKAVRATAEAFAAAFDKGDAKALAALWTEDCEFVDGSGTMVFGREAVEKVYAGFFETNPGVKIEISISSIKTVGGQTAIEDGNSTVKDAKGRVISRGAYTAVHLKEGDKWLMATVREFDSPSLSARPIFKDLGWLIGDWTAAKDERSVNLSFRWIAEEKFIEASYTAREKDIVIRSGIQIIGRDPSSGEVVSWSFDSTGGYGQGRWRLMKQGLIVESEGVMPDGASTGSTDILSRIDANSFSWQSVNRRVSGKSLNDAEPVILKRKLR
jgi:uncharacterized protein (TIGR02246 family)